MVRIFALTLLAATATTFAAPRVWKRSAGVTDNEVLNFALTLEHLEAAFYEEGLSQLDEQAFQDAGYPSWVRARFSQIQQHEGVHVEFLLQALGNQAVQPCSYDFPFNDAQSFVALAMALETVGASAYMGASRLLTDKATLVDAASILSVESRHAAWINSAVLKGSAWDGSFETPLSPDGVFSLASQFIVSCPDTNAPLPVAALPKLEIQPGSPQPGDSVTFNFDAGQVRKDDSPLFVAFFSGLGVKYSDLGADNVATVPENLQGTIYAAVVKTKAENAPLDQQMLTGLVMFEVAFPSFVDNLGGL